MAKLSQIRRLAILINKLSAVRYVPTDALVAHVENTLALYDNKDSNYSQRTMQRDFGLIDEMFGIVIRNDKSRGYYIAELDKMTDNYKELLLNFELLSSINTDSVLQKYVLAEHRQNAIRHELIAPLLKAIRKRNPIEFDYTLVRHNGKNRSQTAHAPFLERIAIPMVSHRLRHRQQTEIVRSGPYLGDKYSRRYTISP